MGQSYSSSLATDLDRVRFLARDTNVADDQASLEDEEIQWILTEEPNVYFAAARAAQMILNEGRGLDEERIGDLMTKYSEDSESSYRKHIQWLRERGAELLNPEPRAFRVL